MFMRIDGCTEGACSEESVGAFQKVDHIDESYVINFDHKVSIAVSKHSGAVTGNRKHDHFKVKKLLDKASPLLHGKLSSAEKLDRVYLNFYSNTDAPGEPFYTVSLKDAKVVEIETLSPDILDNDSEDKMPYEIISFVFDEITYEHNRASTSATDSWMSGAS